MKEPALSDGRIQSGDKLLAANGVELASFSHQEVIIMMTFVKLIVMTMAIVKLIMMMMRDKLLAVSKG